MANITSIAQGCSVTERIKEIRQPRGGYIPPKTLHHRELGTNNPEITDGNIRATTMGLIMDYMSRYLMTGDAASAFEVSLAGAELIGKKQKALMWLNQINGLNDSALIAAFHLVGYDVFYRVGLDKLKEKGEFDPATYVAPEEPNAETLSNLKIMLTRTMAFFKEYGPVTQFGFTFPGAYTNKIVRGDGDFLTVNTVWDMKTSRKEPLPQYTLQLLIYYLMGKRSGHPLYANTNRLAIYNPRLYTIDYIDTAEISSEIKEEVCSKVIGYSDAEINELRKIW